jgi:hypothetical protein
MVRALDSPIFVISATISPLSYHQSQCCISTPAAQPDLTGRLKSLPSDFTPAMYSAFTDKAKRNCHFPAGTA